MWEHLIEGEARDGYGFILKGKVNDVGYQSVCVPASLKAYYEAHAKFGVLPWREIVAPAIEWAERGWMVRPHVEFFWSDPGMMGRASGLERLAFSSSGRSLYCRDDGTPKRVGDLVRNSDYANTLRMIAEGGSDVFYKGELGRRVARDMREHGGLITAEDLATYQPKWLDPLRGTYRGYGITTNNPPGGGLMLIEMLNILERFDLAEIGHNSAEYLRVVCEAMKRATVDKDRFIGDPAFVHVPVERLASKDYAAEMAREIEAGIKAEVPRFNSGFPSKDTTQVSVVDRDGNCVTMTHSLGMPSGVITDGLGFLLQWMHGCVRSAAGPRGQHRAGQGALHIGVSVDRFPRRQAVSGDRRPGRDADRDGRAAGHPERARLRYDDDRGGERTALLRDQQRDRRFKPDYPRHHAQARGRRLRSDPQSLHLRFRRRSRHPD